MKTSSHVLSEWVGVFNTSGTVGNAKRNSNRKVKEVEGERKHRASWKMLFKEMGLQEFLVDRQGCPCTGKPQKVIPPSWKESRFLGYDVGTAG